MSISTIFCLPLVFGAGILQAAFLGPSPYLSFADSPFNGQSFTYFHLENFESGTLSVPGVSMNVGATALAVIPWRPHSTARQRVRCETAALVMQ